MTEPPSSFLDKVCATAERHGMLPRGGRILAGVSGGTDSAALLHALHLLRERFSLSLGVAHVNHRLRGAESDADAAFVRGLAGKYGLPLFEETADVAGFQAASGLSLEEAGREVRRSFFFRILRDHSFDRIALGHHADDNAEWVLMALIRGAGSKGLSGIPPVNGPVIRPLLETARRQIEGFCREHALQFVSDSTNTDLSLTRNRVRHELLPLLADKYNPRISESLNRLASIMGEEDQWLGREDESALQSCMLPGKEGLALSVPKALDLPRALGRRVIRRAIAQVMGGLRRISMEHVESVHSLLEHGRDQAQVHLPGGLEVRLARGALLFVRHENPRWARLDSSPSPPSWEKGIPGPGRYAIPQAGLELAVAETPAPGIQDLEAGPDIALLDGGLCPFPLVFRPWRAGDRFFPLGMDGSQTVGKYLADHKVPREKRGRECVLVSQGRVVWLAGRRLDNRFRVTPSTVRILQCKVSLA